MALFSNANHSFVWMDDAKEKSPGIVITLERISCFGNFIFPIADNIHNVYGKFLGNSKYWKDIFNKFRNRFLKESGHCGLNPLFVSISLYVLYTDYLF